MTSGATPHAELRDVVAALARGALGDLYTSEIPERVLESIDLAPDSREREALLRTLALMKTRAGALVLTGNPRPVPWLSPREAERVFQRWKTSRLASVRMMHMSLISTILSSLYGYPGPHWERIGYEGPLGDPPDPTPDLQPIVLDHDEVVDCDVVVVGSGAGGGCAAAVLAEAGLNVVVLEKGTYKPASDFTHIEPEAYRDMYLYGLNIATTDLGVRVVAGSTLGGGTVVNYTTSFKTPRFVLEEWARESGIEAFVNGEIEASLDATADRLGVNTESSSPGARDAVMERGLKKLGWHCDALPRAVRDCSQDAACGYCGFGCRIGAKQSTVRTYLQDASAAGARIFTGADVRTVRVEDGRARGVDAIVRDGRAEHRLTVRARAVVVAAGAIETPALLLRSGLGGAVGRNLHLHPGSAAIGVFDEDVRMWQGTTQARYSAEFRDWDGGYGPIFETVPVHLGAIAIALPWFDARDHARKVGSARHLSHVAALGRDRTGGTISLTRSGAARITYNMTAGDQRRAVEGVVQAGKVLEAAGAREIFTLHRNPITYHPGLGGGHEGWTQELRERGLRAGDTTFYSYHQMSSARMGTDPARSAVNADNESHEVSDLFVTDSSTFPTASGVNPMLSIYGIAHRAAHRIAQRYA